MSSPIESELSPVHGWSETWLVGGGITALVLFVSLCICLMSMKQPYSRLFRFRSKLSNHERQAFNLLNRGSIEEFKAHIETNKVKVDLQDNQNLYLLHVAVNRCIKDPTNGLAMIRYLIENGADVNCSDQTGRSPLFMACHWSLRSAVDLLCEFNACKTFRDEKQGYPLNPLYTVLLKSSYKMAWYLIDKKGFSLEIVEDIHLKNRRFKLNAEQLEFIEKAKVMMKRNENRLKVLIALRMGELYSAERDEIVKSKGENPRYDSTELAGAPPPPLILNMLNSNEINEICQFIL